MLLAIVLCSSFAGKAIKSFFRMTKYAMFLPIIFMLLSCGGGTQQGADAAQHDSAVHTATTASTTADSAATKQPEPQAAPAATNGAAFTGTQVPILCYHQIRDWRPKDSKGAQEYIVQLANFKEQMKALHDSGYHTILPDELVAYLEHGKPLPSKPVMLTFDDATGPQVTNGVPELDKYGFKGVFFIMTVVLGRPDYMTKDQVKQLDQQGHVIACHTWDHHMVTKYKGDDWKIQVEKPRALLETITGKPVKYFAYPFGLWNKDAAKHIKDYGFTAAFQLAAKRDPEYPMYTIRRIIPDGHWSTARLMKEIKQDF
jgi:peptidoglycan/xylan/chitin deacetylase (PgdA/CDA1 family)